MAEGINAGLQDELYQEYLHDRTSVDESWKDVFESNGAPPVGQAVAPADGLQPLRGAAARLAGNMEASLAVPTATSQRTIPVKVVDENRTIVNQHLTLVGRDKVSYTHLIGWAIVKALASFPNLNSSYAEREGQPHRRVPPAINLGVAVDVAARDGAHALVVPNIKNAGALDFQKFMAAFDDIDRPRAHGQAHRRGFRGHHHLAHQPGDGRHRRLDSTPDAGAGRHHRHRRHRLSRRVPRRRARDARLHRHQQGHDDRVHLRPPRDPGRRVRALPRPKFRRCSKARTTSTTPSSPTCACPIGPCAGSRTAARSRPAAATVAPRIAQQAAVLQIDQCLPRARPPARRSRSARLRAQLPPRARSRPVRPHHLGPGPRVHHRLARRGHRRRLPRPFATLRQILETVRQTYCGKIGCEYMNIQVPEQKRWLQQRMEPDRQQLAARRRGAPPHPGPPARSRGVRALPARALRGPQALLARRRRDRHGDPGRADAPRRVERACTKSSSAWPTAAA